MAWRTVQLGEVLRQKRDRVRIEPGKPYKQITVRLWGKGLTLRGTCDGSEIAAESQVAVGTNDFLISKIDARHGAFGLVPTDLEGAVVSNDFPCFTVREDLLDPRFLEWFSKTETFVSVCRQASVGSTNRVRLKEGRFLSFEIPLPSLDEQKAIARRLDEAQRQTQDALGLERELESEARQLLINLAHRPDLSNEGKRKAGWSETHFADVITEAAEPHTVEPDKQYPNLGIYSYAKGAFKKSPIDGAQTSAKTLYKVTAGQFIYSRLFAFEGSYTVVPDELDGSYVSNEFPAFKIDPAKATAEFLAAYFSSPKVWSDLAHGSLGLGSRRQRVNQKHLLNQKLFLPPLGYQLRLAAISARLNVLSDRSRREALEALIPAMLHEIFERQAKPEAAPVTSEAKVVQLPAKQKAGIDTPFKEAVLVGAIVKAFHEYNGQPIGNFRLQKAVYFARRQMGESALDKDYLRKAAGPYNPKMRYSGGIKIAMDKNWIKRATGKYGEGNALGDTAAEMDECIERYQFTPAAAWVRDRFKYKSNELWEALATIDYAMLALDHKGKRPTPEAILSYIEADDEWRPKIDKLRLTEASIQNVMVELESLFAGG